MMELPGKRVPQRRVINALREDTKAVGFLRRNMRIALNGKEQCIEAARQRQK